MEIAKEGCVLLMVVVFMLPNGKIGQNDHRKDASYFIFSNLKPQFKDEL